MNKILYPLFAVLTAFSLVSCGDKKIDNPNGGNGNGNGNGNTTNDVEVTIANAEIETRAATLEFGNQAKMNIFAKTYNRIDAPNIVDGVCATLNGNTWTLEPKVYINDKQKNAFVYAVSPYDPSYTDAERIPVDVNRQVDLMYSGYYQAASLTSPNVKLTMKHALSLLSFNIVPVNYSGAGKLTEITLDGDIIYQTGTMNASTGDITLVSKGKVEAKFDKAVTAGGWKSDIPGVWSLPFNTKAGTVKFTAVIDGKRYEAVMPEAEVKTGWQYIFRIVLTNNGLEFDPSKTETKSLNVTTDDAQQFAGYGMLSIVSTGGTVTSPVMNGDAIFGTLITPNGNSSYDGASTVNGLKDGDQVSVESWNSNGFEIESLEGIKTIDISQYE